MERHPKRALVFLFVLMLATLALLIGGVIHLSDVSQAIALLLVGGFGSAVMYGWGDKLVPKPLREGSSTRGESESNEERLRLFRRFYPMSMLKADQLPDSMRPFALDDEGIRLAIRAWLAEDIIASGGLLSKDETRQKESLEGEVSHYLYEEYKKLTTKPNADIVAGGGIKAGDGIRTAGNIKAGKGIEAGSNQTPLNARFIVVCQNCEKEYVWIPTREEWQKKDAPGEDDPILSRKVNCPVCGKPAKLDIRYGG